MGDGLEAYTLGIGVPTNAASVGTSFGSKAAEAVDLTNIQTPTQDQMCHAVKANARASMDLCLLGVGSWTSYDGDPRARHDMEL